MLLITTLLITTLLITTLRVALLRAAALIALRLRAPITAPLPDLSRAALQLLTRWLTALRLIALRLIALRLIAARGSALALRLPRTLILLWPTAAAAATTTTTTRSAIITALSARLRLCGHLCRQADPLALGVDLEDAHGQLLTDLDHLARIFDELIGQL